MNYLQKEDLKAAGFRDALTMVNYYNAVRRQLWVVRQMAGIKGKYSLLDCDAGTGTLGKYLDEAEPSCRYTGLILREDRSWAADRWDLDVVYMPSGVHGMPENGHDFVVLSNPNSLARIGVAAPWARARKALIAVTEASPLELGEVRDKQGVDPQAMCCEIHNTGTGLNIYSMVKTSLFTLGGRE